VQVEAGADWEVREPRSAGELIADAFRLYRRYPWLFFVLAAAVIVPAQLAVYLAFGYAPLGDGHRSFFLGEGLDLFFWSSVTALVSALHMHALNDAVRGRQPHPLAVGRKAMATFPGAVLAGVLTNFAATLGLLLFVIPGVLLWLRWAVATQAASLEGQGGLAGMKRSSVLTRRHYWHIIWVGLLISLIAVPTIALDLAVHDVTPFTFLAALTLRVLTASAGALTTAVLFFDLRARHEVGDESTPPPEPEDRSKVRRAVPGETVAWDPRTYSNDERPRGWYVDPDFPARMRYWGAGDEQRWAGISRTPRNLRRAWRREISAARDKDRE
jgi:hypothetical protein